MKPRIFWVIFALLGIVGVLVAASISHVFPPEIRPFMNTANKMHFVHLIPVGIILIYYDFQGLNLLLKIALAMFFLGYILFPFAIYTKYIFKITAASALAPYGGYAWVLAWFFLGIGLWKRRR